MLKNRKLLGILLSIFMVLAFTVSGFAYYKYTQESGANFYVGTGDKADAQEDTNEMRQILDDLGDLLGHSKRDDLYPKDGTTGGTLSVFTNIVYCNDYDHPDDAITAIDTANKTLLVTEAETCDTNFTVPANVTVKFERGGKWTINGESFGSTTFTGTGLNDATIGGTYIGTSDLNYKIEIDGTGTPDTFKWSDDGGSTWDATLVAIDGTAQALNNGVTVTFGATTGHTLADYWTVTAYHAIIVTFNGQIDAGLWEIFEYVGTGTLAGTPRVGECYPQWWGAKADGTTDDTITCQNALDSGIKTIRFSMGNFLIDPVSGGAYGGLEPANNTILLFDNGVELYAKTNDSNYYSVIKLNGKSNVKIINATIKGDRTTHTGSAGSTVDEESLSGQKVLKVAATTNFTAGDIVIIDSGNAGVEEGTIDTIQAGISITLVSNLTNTHAIGVVVQIVTGEWGHGIYIEGASGRIIIDNMKSYNCWGDGIYIGGASTNISVTNSIFDNNRRQGCSITSAKNVSFKNCQFLNTNGTSPEKGVTLEPNNVDGLLINIVFDSCYSYNNVSSGFSLAAASSLNNPISVSFKNCVSNTDNSGFHIDTSTSSDGLCTIENCYSFNAGKMGFYCKESDIAVNIDGLYVFNSGQDESATERYNSGISIWTNSDNTDAGNIIARNINIESSDAKMLYALCLQRIGGLTNSYINDVDIEISTDVSNEKHFYKSGTTIQFSGVNKIKFIDYPIKATTSNLSTDNMRLYRNQKITNEGATGNLNFYLDDTQVVSTGTEYIIEVVANYSITLNFGATHTLLPDNRQTYTLSEVGTGIKIYSDGVHWFITERIGITLPSYKEGSWTPALKFGGASVGMTYTTQAGLHTKIGRMETVSCRIFLSAKGTSTGDATITGLPSTSKNVDGAMSAVALRLVFVTFANFPQGYINKNDNKILLSEITEAGVSTNLDNTDFADNSSIVLTATYFTD